MSSDVSWWIDSRNHQGMGDAVFGALGSVEGGKWQESGADIYTLYVVGGSQVRAVGRTGT